MRWPGETGGAFGFALIFLPACRLPVGRQGRQGKAHRQQYTSVAGAMIKL